MRQFVMACAAVVALAWCAGAQAELTAGQKLAAETLIKDFSAKEFAVRQQAVDKLIALGPDVVPIVRKALAETTDNEVKLRCQMTLKGIAAKYGVGLTGAPAAEEEIADGFEDYDAEGSPGGGWVMRFNADADRKNNKVVDDGAFSGDKCLQVYARGYAAHVGRHLPASKDPFVVTVMVRPGDEATREGFGLEAKVGLVWAYEGVYAYDTGAIGFRADRTITHWGPVATFVRNPVYTPKAWHVARIAVLPGARRFFYSVDGQYLGCRGDIPDAQWPADGFHVDLCTGNGIVWFDDLSVRKVGAAGPYLEPLAILTQEIAGRVKAAPGPMTEPVDFKLLPQELKALFLGAGAGLPQALLEQCDRFQREKTWLVAFGDVELGATDPLGRRVGPERADIPKAAYVREDLDGDGKKETSLLLDKGDLPTGTYSIEVVNPDARNAAGFSLFYYDPEKEILTPLAWKSTIPAGAGRKFSLSVGR